MSDNNRNKWFFRVRRVATNVGAMTKFGINDALSLLALAAFVGYLLLPLLG